MVLCYYFLSDITLVAKWHNSVVLYQHGCDSTVWGFRHGQTYLWASLGCSPWASPLLVYVCLISVIWHSEIISHISTAYARAKQASRVEQFPTTTFEAIINQHKLVFMIISHRRRTRTDRICADWFCSAIIKLLGNSVKSKKAALWNKVLYKVI